MRNGLRVILMRWLEAVWFALVRQKLLRDFSSSDSLVFAKTTRSHLLAWTEIKGPKYQRGGLCYGSSATDGEGACIEPHIPPPASCGRTRVTSMREVVNA